MFGLGYVKVDPTTYLIHFVDGRIKREGQGLAFAYWRPNSSLVAVPTSSVDVPFIFNELTADFQAVALQGQLTYRIADPKRVAAQLNFTLQADGHSYVSDDPDKLGQRLVNLTQVLTRPVVERFGLEAVLTASEPIMTEVYLALAASPAVQALGVEVIAFSILSIRPTPEMSRAIEARAREGLQKQADEAISARRNAAVEQERRIRENELLTEQVVQTKKQALARAELAADIALEQERAQFVSQRAANAREEADMQAYSLEATLAPLAKLDPRALQFLTAGSTDARTSIALAFQELAANAQRVGQLNITPDLLSSLLKK
ncbi:MAG: SPFH/band 7 domain protein [Cyanobacteria bacterium RYN_339]|nr:SPFH/band 7 domain protein [Cyanobacteria bacterium RYN_339]